MRYAFNLPLFDHLAHERVLADLAAEAEQAGWDAVLVWDHVNFIMPGMAEGGPHAEPWIALALMAERTERVLLGTCVTPVPRRRPMKLAREILALQRLSNGRFVFGAGLGVSPYEFDELGDEPDPRKRAQMLDEGLALLTRLWSGEAVDHRGAHYRATSPVAPDRQNVPIWLAATWPNRKPFARAAHYDGVFAMKAGFVEPLTVAEVVEIAAFIDSQRPDAADSEAPFNLAVGANTSGNLERDRQRARELEAAGANWWLDGTNTRMEPMDTMLTRLRAGPPA